MAKIKTAPLSISTLFATVFWFKPNNWRSDYGSADNLAKLQTSLADRGWVENNAVSVCPIQKDEDLPESERKAGKKSEYAICMEERFTRWEALRNATNPDAAKELTVFEKLYVRDGKLIEPRYSGNAGFRRASVYEKAMLQRFNNPDVPDADKIRTNVPVVVKDYDGDEAARIIDQQLENELQGVGTEKIADKDKLRVAMKLFRMGKREIYLRQLYTATTGQKLFNICLLDFYWPSLKVYDRINLPATADEYIPYAPLKHSDLIKLNNRKEADDKRREGRKLNDKERGMEPLTEEEVAKYLNDAKEGLTKGNDPKIMPKKEIESIAQRNAVEWIRASFKAVMEDNTAELNRYVDYADQINLHKTLIDSGNHAVAFTALQIAHSVPDVINLMSEAMVILNEDELRAVVTAAMQSKQTNTVAIPGTVTV